MLALIERKSRGSNPTATRVSERAVKRCVNVGKNSKKYTGKLLDQLEFDYLFLYMTNSGFSPFSSYEHIRRKSIFATIPKHMPKSLSS